MAAKITREELKAKLENGAGVALVEALPAKYYREKQSDIKLLIKI